jgi:hypothetical protein
MTAVNGGGEDMAERNGPEPVPQGEANELKRIVKRAKNGDQTVLPELRRFLDSRPDVWRHAGDLARIAEESTTALAAGKNLLLKESLSRKLAELKTELAGESPSLLDRLLVERVAICWLAAGYSDAAAAQSSEAAAPKVEQARRRQDSAGRRYAEALKLLATMRRLLGPGKGKKQRDPPSSRG